ncbi:Scr1 family TA system antitoxin-like transcriptional regulator [Streptomyces pseudovenezuelae]
MLRPHYEGLGCEAVDALLAHFRKQARLTQEQSAETASIHVDTVRSIEQGRLALQPDRAEQFDQLLATKGALQFAQSLVDHEQEAMSVLSYESLAIPGPLQTQDYCRAVFDCRYPAIGTETAEQWVNARMERQLVLQRERPPVCHFVLEESILQRPVVVRR